MLCAGCRTQPASELGLCFPPLPSFSTVGNQLDIFEVFTVGRSVGRSVVRSVDASLFVGRSVETDAQRKTARKRSGVGYTEQGSTDCQASERLVECFLAADSRVALLWRSSSIPVRALAMVESCRSRATAAIVRARRLTLAMEDTTYQYQVRPVAGREGSGLPASLRLGHIQRQSPRNVPPPSSR